MFAFYVVDLENPSLYKSGAIVLGAVVMTVNIQIFYQSHIYDGIFIFTLVTSVALYFGFWEVMNLPFYKNELLLGTFTHAMGDGVTYMGLLVVVVLVYWFEKLTILLMGQCYYLKYNKA
jgi:hypothetical protein